jgi:peptidoglycan/xylan/chitin deacetylase (PgdA/CDA1 family)
MIRSKPRRGDILPPLLRCRPVGAFRKYRRGLPGADAPGYAPSPLPGCALAALFCSLSLKAIYGQEQISSDRLVCDQYGAIVRGDVTVKRIALLFTGDEFGESTVPILDALKARGLKASFFVTGNFLRKAELRPLVARIVEEGHYLGPHSDSHPLYCDWENREKSLVSREFFAADLRKNIAALQAAGAMRKGTPVYFVPPYEWYNAEQVAWSRELGVRLVNFTPGSGSNRDYAPEGDKRFVSSQRIYDDILAYQARDRHGLNGFLLLLHLGSGRKDPFHPRLGPLCDELTKRGYAFERVDQLLAA